jgi:thiosulfate reductase cytochrome b subunit
MSLTISFVSFIGYLIRSGVQILGSYPRLYWNDDSAPGHEWLTLTRRKIPTNRVWTSLEQELDVPGWLGHPGGANLGLGRIWHFFTINFSILNGVVYVALLILSGEWTRLAPTNWSIFPRAWKTFTTYLTLRVPPASAFQPYDALQQLSYFAVVFLLGPFLIATGAAQSPAIAARSLHFLGLLAFVVFILIHTLMVVLTGAGRNHVAAVTTTRRHALVVSGRQLRHCLHARTWRPQRAAREAQPLSGGFAARAMAQQTHGADQRQAVAPATRPVASGGAHGGGLL